MGDVFKQSSKVSGVDAEKKGFPNPRSDGRVRLWYYEKNPRTYGMYMVVVHSRSGNKITYTMLGRETALEVGGKITVDLVDGTKVYNELPSTVHLVDPASADNCGFMLMSDTFVNELKVANIISDADVAAAEGRNPDGGRSKWPKGAGGALLQRLVENRTKGLVLTAGDYDDLVTLLGELK